MLLGLILSDLSQAGLARELLLQVSEKTENLLDRLLKLPRPGRRSSPAAYAKAADQAWRKGIRACLYNDPAYPFRLRQISGFPLVLYFSGLAAAEKWNHQFAVAVVGSRRPTAYGRLITGRIAAELAQNDTLVISGLARGIDGLAHRAVLDQQGLTMAVVAHGLDFVYPPEHAGLLQMIKSRGLVVSEHPPGTRPQKYHFPARNRLISGLSDVVVITEAAQKSGSLITAGFAADQGREVLAAPGSILNSQSRGCHQLIKDGAGLLETTADILALRRPGLPES